MNDEAARIWATSLQEDIKGREDLVEALMDEYDLIRARACAATGISPQDFDKLAAEAAALRRQ